jgi:hypothetical protein
VFIAGVVDTGDKLQFTGNNDTSDEIINNGDKTEGRISVCLQLEMKVLKKIYPKSLYCNPITQQGY